MLFQFGMTWSRTMLLLVLFAISVSLSGQEKTAAGLYNEGLALLKTKDYAGGLVLLEEAMVIAEADGDEKIIGLGKKNGAVAANNVGNAKRKAGAMDEALTYYNKAIALNPDYSSSYEGVGRVLEKQGKGADAITSFLKAASMAQTNGKAKRAESRFKKVQTMVGKMYVGKDYDGAITGANAFIEVNDTDADVHYYLSQALAAKEDYATSTIHIAKAIELSGAEAPDKFHYAQGEQLEKLGKNADAIAAYKKITEEKFKAQATYRIGELGGE